MAVRKTIIGDVPCPVCGVSCAVRSEGGDKHKTLGYPCSQGCDSPNWAPAGTEAHRIILTRMKPRGNTEPEKPQAPRTAAPAPAAPAAPAPAKKTTTIFD